MSSLEKGALLRRWGILLGLCLILLLIFFLGTLIGRYALTPGQVFETLVGGGSLQSRLAIFEIRLPRILLAILVGMGMGTSGVILQGLLQNDLASPGTLGVSDGASLAVTFYLLLVSGKMDNPILMPLFALLGGLLSAGLIYRLGTRKGKPISPMKLVMTGVAMSAVYSAISTLLVYALDESQLEFVQRWQSGELWGTEWQYIGILAVWITVFFVLVLGRARSLNAIQLGYDMAASIGVPIRQTFGFFAFCALALSSASVAFGGNFFFLGLIGPHIARGLVGTDNRFLLPSAGLVSAILITLSVILVENVSLLTNIPTGIFISILSVPYFLYLLIKTR